jgi:hypothetical protein
VEGTREGWEIIQIARESGPFVEGSGSIDGRSGSIDGRSGFIDGRSGSRDGWNRFRFERSGSLAGARASRVVENGPFDR